MIMSAQRSPATPRTATRGVTVTIGEIVTPLYDAWIVTGVDAATASVVTVKVAEVAPCNTVTDPGTVATAEFRLVRHTVAPPVGAGASSVTVPNDGVP